MNNPLFNNKERAHAERNIKLLLQPYFQFRLYIVFKCSDGRPGPKRHFYGNEHQCTYLQLLFNKLPIVTMDRLKGYNDLVYLVEEKYKGKYIGAKIFSREPSTEQFNNLHRDYLRGEVLVKNDPVITLAESCYHLNYHIENGRVIIDK